jgi:hypothetical protein
MFMPNPALKSERVFETTKGQERKVTTWPMSTRKRRITIPQLVKRVDLTREYPGYRYVYFETYAELDAYFTAECGPDWRQQEWAKEWFREEWSEEKAEKEARRRKVQYEENQSYEQVHRKDPESLTSRKVPKHILKSLAQFYFEKERSLRLAAVALKENENITISHVTLRKILLDDE